MIQISPHTLGDIGKRILTNISKYIVDKQQTNDDEDRSFFHGNFTLLPDEPHSDSEIGADTRVKVISLTLPNLIPRIFFNSVN
jgi:hypothetical protein